MSRVSLYLRPRVWFLPLLAVALVVVYAIVERLYVSERTAGTLEASRAALAFAGALLDNRGPLSVEGDQLYAGEERLNASTTVVDRVSSETGFGCTIFLADRRIATSAVAEGQKERALGTRASPEIARQVLEKGETFSGVTHTIGKDWVVTYVPLVDPAGSRVGMLSTYKERAQLQSELLTFRLLLGGTLLALFLLLAFISLASLRWTRAIESQAERIADQNDRLRAVGDELVAQTAALRQAQAEAQSARAAAEEASEAKSAFLASMSHELRTPLNAIIGYSEMLSEDQADMEPEEVGEDLERITTAGRHLLSLLNNILDLSKIEAGRMELFCEDFDVAELASEIADTAAPLVARNGNRFELDLPPELPTMYADLTKLRQALLNLVGNASKFTEQGTVRLAIGHTEATEEAPAHLRFDLSDTGVGMTEEQLARIFERFTQAEASTSRNYGGTGLGLAITRSLCDLMGGQMEVESEVGVGTTFSLILPVRVECPGTALKASPSPPR